MYHQLDRHPHWADHEEVVGWLAVGDHKLSSTELIEQPINLDWKSLGWVGCGEAMWWCLTLTFQKLDKTLQICNLRRQLFNLLFLPLKREQWKKVSPHIIIIILYCTTLAKRRLLRRVRVKNRGCECSCVGVGVCMCVCVRVRTHMSGYIYM